MRARAGLRGASFGGPEEDSLTARMTAVAVCTLTVVGNRARLGGVLTCTVPTYHWNSTVLRTKPTGVPAIVSMTAQGVHGRESCRKGSRQMLLQIQR